MTRTQLVLAASVLLSLAAWMLGAWGFYHWDAIAAEVGDEAAGRLGDAAYRALQMFHFEFDVPEGAGVPPPAVQIARFFGPLAASLAILTAIWVFVRHRLGGLRARWQREHIVLCGAGEKGVRMVQRFARGEYDRIGRRTVVVVDLAAPDAANLLACREAGALTITGDARDPATLARAGVARAKYLVLTSGNDGTNAEIALQARELVSTGRTNALRCFAHLTDPVLCRLLREREFEVGAAPDFRLEFFNIYSSAALALLQEHPPFRIAEGSGRAREGAEGDGTDRHVVVVGLDPLGQSAINALARSWVRGGHRPRGLRLSLFDADAGAKLSSLCRVDPALTACADLRAYDLDRRLPAFDRDVLEGVDGAPRAHIAYICLHDDGESLTAALALVRATRSRRLPVVVTMMEDSGLASLLGRRGGEFQDLRGFPVLDHGCTADVLRGRKEEIARAVHADYVEKARADGRAAIDDPSLRPWVELPESLKRSNRRQADHIFAKLEAIGCALAPYDPTAPEPFAFEAEEVERLARMEHERWVRERGEDGWRFAAEKDVERKLTPYLVSWEELDEKTRDLDRNAIRNLPALVALADLVIVRQRPWEADPEAAGSPDG